MTAVVTPFPQSEDKRSFTSWKLDVQQAMMCDDRLNASAFRIGIYILSLVNADTKVAYVTDLTVSLLVPGCRSRTTIYKARKLLKETGWISTKEGRSGRATVYRFNDKHVNPIFDIIASKRDWRDSERQRKRLNAPNPSVHISER